MGKDLRSFRVGLHYCCYSVHLRNDWISQVHCFCELADLRGVELSHRNVVTNVEQGIVQGFSTKADQDWQTNPDILEDHFRIVTLCHTPFSHVSGIAWYVGWTLRTVICPRDKANV